MKMNCHHIKSSLNNMKYNLSITLFVFCSFIGKLSSQQVNIQEVKIQQYVKILNPPFQTTDTIRKFSFLVTPEVKPNSSLRIVETNNRSFLEVRVLDKNIKEELYATYRDKDFPNLKIKTHFFSIPISSQFAKKVLDVFFKIKKLEREGQKIYDNGKLLTEHFDLFDGSNYEFLAYVNGKVESTSIQVGEEDPYNTDPIESSDYIYKVKLTNVKIINDVKNGTFKESNYDIYK